MSSKYDVMMCAIIVFNLAIIVYETDYEAQCYPKYSSDPSACPLHLNPTSSIRIINMILLSFYTLEALLRLFVERGQYLYSKWNWIDVIVVIAGWTGQLIGGTQLQFLRIVRVARLTRAFRALLAIRELYLLLNGIVSSIKAIFWGTILIFVMLVGYGILLVYWVHPVNSKISYFQCEECTLAFRSVWYSVLTLFKQLVAGDTWVMSFPLFEERLWFSFLIMGIIVSISIAALNLILTVVVEMANEARENNIRDQAHQKASQNAETRMALMKICSQMDRDGSGTLTTEELLGAYAISAEFRDIMTMMDVQQSEIESIFKMLDSDGSGVLDYEEFCDELIELQSQDARMTMALIRFNILDVRTFLEQSLEKKIGIIEARTLAQDQMLTEIHRKLDFLGPRVEPEKSKWYGGKSDNCYSEVPLCLQGDPAMPVAPDIPDSSVERLDVMLNKLVLFQKELQSLAVLEADLVKEAEQQVSALLGHAELVASFVDVFPQDRFGRVPLKDGLAKGPLGGLQSEVMKIHKNMGSKLPKLMQEMEAGILVANGTLCANKRILKEIAMVLPKTMPDPKLSEHVNCASDPISRM